MKKTLLLCLSVFCVSITINSQTFTRQDVDLSTGEEPYELASGDFNGDGNIDLVMGTYLYDAMGSTQDYIKYYINDGSGGFTITTLSDTIRYVDGLTVADINNDGFDDIIATSVDQNKLVYFLSLKDAMDDSFLGFGTEVVIDTVTSAGDVVAGHLNGDAHIDLVVASYGGNKTQWYSGNAGVTFNTESDIESGTTDGPFYLDIADYDGDTDLDILVGFANTGSIEIFYNQFDDTGSTTWIQDLETVDASSTFLFQVAFADVNNDEVMDVVKVDFSGGLVAWYDKPVDGLPSLPNTICDGTIISNPGHVVVADIDNDSQNDVIVTDGGTTDDAMIWFKGADGAPPATMETLIVNNSYQMFDVLVGDFDGDTDIDIATLGNGHDSVDWWENDLNPLSVEDQSLENIKIFPNPANNIINFKGLANNGTGITVTDMLGRKVINRTINSDNTLNISQLNSGIYIIKFENIDATYKFIKE